VREHPIRMPKVIAQEIYLSFRKFGISKKLTMNVVNIFREDLQKKHVDFLLEI